MKKTEMTIHGLTMDPKNSSPVVLLKDAGTQRALPIWIGLYEANAIATCLAGIKPPRPMTHDLLYNTLQEAGYTVNNVVITELKDNTFYAMIGLSSEKGELEVDSRPSDAIALAVRAESPIFVNEEVLEQSAIDLSALEIDESRTEKDELLEMLENMDPEDFSKYKM